MGDFSANFARPSAGIHTVEGTVAGSRAAALEKQREVDQALFESKKQQIHDDHVRQQQSIQSKFAGSSIGVTKKELSFQQATVGLVTAEQFRELQQRQLQNETSKDNRDASDCTNVEGDQQETLTLDEQKKRRKMEKKAHKEKLKAKKQRMATLSFAHDDDDDDVVDDNVQDLGDGKTLHVATAAAAMIAKDPTIDTSFLPDKQRHVAEQRERERLRREWQVQQQQTRKSTLEIVYSYWDGSGHRRTVQVQQGDTIGTFLEVIRKELSREFRELASIGADALLYVKEDLILPHDLTFYDLIATKARGKSGPLFAFDVHEDVRVGAIDVRVEKDESHPGKVIQRHWYERNKHIFPASRWEVYDPTKDYGAYRIGGA